MEKMTIEKAREIVSEIEPLKTATTLYSMAFWTARGFIVGWESRQAEVEKLREALERIETYSGAETFMNNSFMYNIHEYAMKGLGWAK